jgi:hypothetical protein
MMLNTFVDFTFDLSFSSIFRLTLVTISYIKLLSIGHTVDKYFII